MNFQHKYLHLYRFKIHLSSRENNIYKHEKKNIKIYIYIYIYIYLSAY